MSSSSTTADDQQQEQQAPPPLPPRPATHHPSRAMKALIPENDVVVSNEDGSSELPPITPSVVVVQVGNKLIKSDKPARKWVWAPFASSARNDGAMFHHWVRAGVDYPTYPFARFDVHLDPVQYTDDEYNTYLQASHPWYAGGRSGGSTSSSSNSGSSSNKAAGAVASSSNDARDSWTKSETDRLMELCRIFELRWAVIYDRWQDEVGEDSGRKVEDLQYRYYQVAATLAQVRIAKEANREVNHLVNTPPPPPDATTSPQEQQQQHLMETAAARSLALGDRSHQPLISNIATGTNNKSKVFDLVEERQRRQHLDMLWNRTRAEEREEESLRQELKVIETQLRKFKRNGGHLAAAATAAATRAPSPRLPTVAETTTSVQQACNFPVPTPGTPYLQSARLHTNFKPNSAVPKVLWKRTESLLQEDFGIRSTGAGASSNATAPSGIIPTKRICDLYDSVRKDTLTLLALQKILLQKEGQLQTKRLRLSKLGGLVGERVLDEDALLGIAPQPPPPPPVPARPAAVPPPTIAPPTVRSTAAVIPAHPPVPPPPQQPVVKQTANTTTTGKGKRAATNKGARKAGDKGSGASKRGSAAGGGKRKKKDTKAADGTTAAKKRARKSAAASSSTTTTPTPISASSAPATTIAPPKTHAPTPTALTPTAAAAAIAAAAAAAAQVPPATTTTNQKKTGT